MPREGVTIYDLLISCPGDVTGYLQLIKEAVDNFNKLYGSLNNIQESSIGQRIAFLNQVINHRNY